MTGYQMVIQNIFRKHPIVLPSPLFYHWDLDVILSGSGTQTSELSEIKYLK